MPNIVVPYQVAKFNAWLVKQGFTDLDWSNCHEQYPVVAMPVAPEHMLTEVRLLAKLLREDLLIQVASSDEIDESEKLLPCVMCSFTPGDDHAWITVENIDDRTMRDAIMRLAS